MVLKSILANVFFIDENKFQPYFFEFSTHKHRKHRFKFLNDFSSAQFFHQKKTTIMFFMCIYIFLKNERRKKRESFLFNHNQGLHWAHVFYVADRIVFVMIEYLGLDWSVNANRNHDHENSEPKWK